MTWPHKTPIFGSELPAFPSGLPTAIFDTIVLQKLIDGDELEEQRLFHACKGEGFFYLDLRNIDAWQHSQGDFVDTAQQVFDIGTDIMNWPFEQKLKYETDDRVFAYKSPRRTKIRTEIFNFCGYSPSSPFANPNGIFMQEDLPTTKLQLIEQFTHTSYNITNVIIDVLNKHLHLAPGTLAKLHNDPSQSAAHVSFTKTTPLDEPENTPDPSAFNAHTDHGSVTLVFHKILGGLQVLQPEMIQSSSISASNNNSETYVKTMAQTHQSTSRMRWVYAKPLPGHAIVNLGNAMKVFSGGQLRSAIHRVVEAPGEQREFIRYSLVYFSTPKENTKMKSLVNGADEHVVDVQTYADFCTNRLEKPKSGVVGNSGVFGSQEVQMVGSA